MTANVPSSSGIDPHPNKTQLIGYMKYELLSFHNKALIIRPIFVSRTPGFSFKSPESSLPVMKLRFFHVVQS